MKQSESGFVFCWALFFVPVFPSSSDQLHVLRLGKEEKMSYNNGYEKKEFIRRHVEMRKEYQDAGMDEALIEDIFIYDWEIQKSERVYREHCAGADEACREATSEDEYFAGEGDWPEQLEDERLYRIVSQLTADQKHILWLYAFEGKTQEEIAKELGVNQSAIAKRLNRIRNKFKSFK